MGNINSNYPAPHPDIAWQDGNIVRWEDCVVHVRTQAGFFGANIFEGIRAYWNSSEERLYVFRLDEHLKRLHQSMKIMRMISPYSSDELKMATLNLLKQCDFRQHAQANIVSCFGFPAPGDPLSANARVGANITAVPMGRSVKTETGLSAGISSWRRITDDAMPIRVKIGSNYQNGRLAQNQVSDAGYEMALLQNSNGKVCEAPGACIFMLRDGQLITPPLTSDILESITRDTVLELAKRYTNLNVVERDIDKSELYLADEAFICGSIIEITPITSVDGIQINQAKPGAVTREIQALYFSAVEGRLAESENWCTPV